MNSKNNFAPYSPEGHDVELLRWCTLLTVPKDHAVPDADFLRTTVLGRLGGGFRWNGWPIHKEVRHDEGKRIPSRTRLLGYSSILVLHSKEATFVHEIAFDITGS